MGEIRLHEGELNIMELLWSNKVLAAKDIAKIIDEFIGWKKNTTYTVIDRLVEKGAIERKDPGYLCRAKITKSEVRANELNGLLNKLFDGSITCLMSEYVKEHKLKTEELQELNKIINNYMP